MILKKYCMLLCAMMLLISSLSVSAIDAISSTTKLTPMYNKTYSDPAKLYEDTVDSMLYIEVKDASGNLYGFGSGVILKEDGTFVTCFHVIAEADVIEVKLKDGSRYTVNGFRYINPLSDVAILTLDTTRTFKPLQLSNASQYKIGKKVYTISNPQGFTFSFSDGMLSQNTKDYLQFTAPVSPGSSGGALLDTEGKLLGIITAIAHDSQNVNIALPNEYFSSKITNRKIENTNGLLWIDFIGENLSEDEFSLVTNYALDEKNSYMFYRYLRVKMLPIKYDIPVKVYPVLGYLALWNGYYDDAILWYKLSYDKNYNSGTAAYGLFWLYCIKNNSAKYEYWYNKIITSFPMVWRFMEQGFAKHDNCKLEKDEDTCNLEIAVDALKYLYDNTDFNWK